MQEIVHFRIRSPENFARLCITAMYENRKLETAEDKAIFSVWYDCFNSGDDAECDKLVREILEDVMPDGGTIGKFELEKVLDASIEYVKQHYNSQFAKQRYDMLDSAIYSSYNNVVQEVPFAKHTSTVYEMTKEFFGKRLCEFKADDIKRFILSNFKIKGSQFTLETIADDIIRYYGRY